MLAPTEIIAAAEAQTGIKDTDTHLHANLEALITSINTDASLPPSGESWIRSSLVARTVDRLEGLKWLQRCPDISEEPITAPVFLTGPPRSGTTAFQYLFDRDPRFRLVRTWEGITPNPPPGLDAASVTRRKAEWAARRAASRPETPGFDALHLHDADGPEECHAFMEQAYAAAGFYNLLDVPGYIDWLLAEADMTAAYRLHKRQLQLLQYKMPTPRWAVKYPNHALAMDAILSVYPDARFVMTHRDPVQVLASICKLTVALRSSRSGVPADPHQVGRQMFAFIKAQIDRTLAFDAGPHGDRVTHVDYYALLDNPADAMKDVHAGLGIDTPPQVQQAIADWHRANPKGARGANPYALEQYGLEESAVVQAYRTYTKRFTIPREADGLRRTA